MPDPQPSADAADARTAPTEPPLDALLAALGCTSHEAAVAYEALRERLILFFTWKGASAPTTLVDRTLDRMARKLADGEQLTREPVHYALAVARYVFLESVKAEARERTAAQEVADVPTHDVEHEARLAAIDACLSGMDPPDADLLREYHAHRGQRKISVRKALAQARSTSLNALRIRVMRLRRALESCVRDRMESDMPPAEPPPRVP